MIINLNEDTITAKKDLAQIFPHEFSNRWLINQFITYVLNHFFEKSSSKIVSGYIGEFVNDENNNNCYVIEPTKERQLNQIIPIVDFDGEKCDYNTFISNLHNEGSLIENSDKLLSSKYWSWCPLIDIDMFINFSNYYWIGNNIDISNIKVLNSKVNVSLDIIGKKSYTYYDIDNYGNKIIDTKYEFNNGDIVVFLKDESKSYNNVPYIITGVENGGIRLISLSYPILFLNNHTNVSIDIIGKETYRYEDNNNYIKSFDFVNGLRIVLLDDEIDDYNNKIYIIEGVGKGIKLIEDNNFSDYSKKDYFTINRNSIDRNKWSVSNRWVHKSSIELFNSGSITPSETMYFSEFNKNIIYNKNDIVRYDNGLYIAIKDDIYGEFVKSDWNYLTGTSLEHASYPIICFNENIELYNYGKTFKGYVDYVYDGESSDIIGKSVYDVSKLLNISSSINLNQKTILCLKDDVNISAYYEITVYQETVILSSIGNGDDIKTNQFDCYYVKPTSKIYSNENIYYNNGWNISQEKVSVNQSPLFNLYDYDKILLSNDVIYNETTFKGNKLFDYKEEKDSNYKLIDEINRYIKIDDIEDNNYSFINCMYSEKYYYTPYNEYQKEIEGFKFVKILGEDEYINDWHLSSNMHTTYLKTRITAKSNMFEEKDINGVLYNCIGFKLLYSIASVNNVEPIIMYNNGEIIDSSDYIIENNNEIYIKNINVNDIIDVKFITEDDINNLNDEYVFDIPLSLTVNQNNENIVEISYNNCFDQMVDIIEHQNGIIGSGYGNNNYYNINHNLSVGNKIIQQSQTLLKTMGLINNSSTSIRASFDFVMQQYSMFKTKFENIVEKMYQTGRINDFDFTSDNTQQIDEVIIEIINQINIGKIGDQPFMNNGMVQLLENCYIPSTPAYLGISNCYKPRIELFKNHFKNEDISIIICHDGSFKNVTGTIKDYIYLRLETLIYESINVKFKDKINGINRYSFYPGKFRKTIYTRKNILDVYSQHFFMWCHINNLSYKEHYNFNYDNIDKNSWKTWNYTGCKDKDNEELVGSYRNIYQYYYDTYRPDTHPWEMLGFGDKPSWWDSAYGSYPYTSSNIKLWSDIENGIILEGENAGEYQELKRPGLISQYMPVDNLGNLKSPLEIGIIDTIPSLQNAKKEWKIGDFGEMEMVYMQTSEYKFIQELVAYLLRPCEWVETNWDTTSTLILFKNTSNEQIINNTTKYRDSNSSIIMHNEIVDGERVRKIGFQQWISDYLIYNSKDINLVSNKLKNSSINLGYRCSGFYEKDSINVYTDSFGDLPEENIHVSLYKSYSNDICTYSAIKIYNKSDGYVVEGFDKTYPYFKTLEPFYNGKKTSIEENNVTVYYYNNYTDNIKLIPYGTKFKTIQELYTMIISYGKYLENKEGWYFTSLNSSGEISNFRLSGRSFLTWASAQSNKNDGSVLLLNPGMFGLGIYSKGMIDDLSKNIDGYPTIININGQAIDYKKISVLRNPYKTFIKTNDEALAYIKVRTFSYEHLICFDNETLFGDVLYNPLYSTIITRLKISGIKATNWYGTLYAPGYLIENNGAIKNYDKIANDLYFVFDVDNVNCQGKLGEYSRGTVGFYETKTNKSLFKNNKSMFDFYKGSIREKGTKNVLNKINRSSFISSVGQNVELYENWLFKAGTFGYSNDKSTIECLLEPQKMIQNAQIITFETIVSNYFDELKIYNKNDIVVYNNYQYKCLNDNITGKFNLNNWEKIKYIGNYIVFWNDDKWIKKPISQSKSLINLSDNRNVNPVGGFAMIDECRYIVADENEAKLYYENMNIGDIIWIVKNKNDDWDILKKTGKNKFISMKYNTISDAYNQNEIDYVYHFTDNHKDYYTNKNGNEITDDTPVYNDIDLSETNYLWKDMVKPVFSGNVYQYINGKKYKIKLYDSVFETTIPENEIVLESPIWSIGKEDLGYDSFTYSNLLLTMTQFGKNIYKYVYPLSITIDNKVSNPKIIVNNVNLVEENSNSIKLFVSSGDKIHWEASGDGTQVSSGDITVPLNGESAPLDIHVTLNYYKGYTLISDTSHQLQEVVFSNSGQYTIELVGGGGGASGSSYKKGKRYSGNGGASGAYIKINLTISQEEINRDNLNGRRYYIYSGKGGTGGLGDYDAGQPGSSGETSYFCYKELDGTIKNIAWATGGASAWGARDGLDTNPLPDGRIPRSPGIYGYDTSEYTFDVTDASNGQEAQYAYSDGQYGLSVYPNANNETDINKKYGQGGEKYYLLGVNGDGKDGITGFSQVEYISETIENTIKIENVDCESKALKGMDSNGYSSYFQEFILKGKYFYSYSTLYEDDMRPDASIVNDNTKFYLNRSRKITAYHKNTVSKNLWSMSLQKHYSVGDTVTYSETGSAPYTYYICIQAHDNSGIFQKEYWEEYKPSYYYKIDSNDIDENSDKYFEKTGPEKEYKLYLDKDCKENVYKDKDPYIMTVDDLDLERDYVYEESYTLVDEFARYADIRPIFIQEPAWSETINQNGYYELVSGRRTYYTKNNKTNLEEYALEYLTNNSIDESLKEELTLYNDENCTTIAQRIDVDTSNGNFDYKYENLLYSDIINVETDNYDLCYEYTDGEDVLYSTSKTLDKSNDERSMNTPMYSENTMENIVGLYKDYVPTWDIYDEYTPNSYYNIIYSIKSDENGNIKLLDKNLEEIVLYFEKDDILYPFISSSIISDIEEIESVKYGIVPHYDGSNDELLKLYTCIDINSATESDNGFGYIKDSLFEIYTDKVYIELNENKSILYSKEDIGSEINKNEDLNTNIELYYNNQCFGKYINSNYFITETQEKERINLIISDIKEDIIYQLLLKYEETGAWEGSINEFLSNGIFIDEEEANEYKSISSNQYREFYNSHICRVVSMYRNENGERKVYKKLYQFGKNYYEVKEISSNKSLTNIGLLYGNIELNNTYYRNDNVETYKNLYKIVNSINYFDKNDIVYIVNDSYSLRNKEYNYAVSDTNMIGSQDGVYNGNGEYSWLKLEYIDEDYKFNLIDIEKRNVNMNNVESCYLVEDNTDKTIIKVQLYDPIQSIIPNDVLNEVNYISSVDPVIDYYDIGKWSDNKIGYLWWDTSKVRYLNYHLGDLKYKRENWGKQLPGSEIAIMEWTKSNTMPTDGRKYVEKVEYNSETESNETNYYYWVKNPSVIPQLSFRNNSAFSIANIINNPSSMGIIWGSIINSVNYNYSELSFMICEYNEVTQDDNIVLQINFNSNKDVEKHSEWVMIKENTESDIPDYLWNKFKDSLLGYKIINNIKYPVPDPELSSRQKIGISYRPRQSMFRDIVSARRNFIDCLNDIFNSRTLDNIYQDVSGEIPLFIDKYDSSRVEYEFEALTKLEMMSWKDENLIGSNVYVKYDESHDNIWAIYKINSITDDENGYELLDYQKYNIEKYIEYKDWYKNKEVQYIIPTYEINNESDINLYMDKIGYNQIIKVISENDWKLYQKVKSLVGYDIETVGISNAILYIKSDIYDYTNYESDNNEYIYINGESKTKYDYIVEECNILLEKIIDYINSN